MIGLQETQLEFLDNLWLVKRDTAETGPYTSLSPHDCLLNVAAWIIEHESE